MSSHQNWANLGSGGPELYERIMVPAVFDAWATELLALGQPCPGDRVLDLACGTGAVTRRVFPAVQPGGTVSALDISPAMLEHARTVCDAQIDFREGSALDLPFADESFDLVLCQQGLQFFPDRAKALQEVRRVLAPHGRLALAVFCAAPCNTALATAVTEHLGWEIASLLVQAISLADPNEIRLLLGTAGFQQIEITRLQKTAHFASTDDFLAFILGNRPAAAVAALTPTAREALFASARAALQPFANPDGLATPMESHLISAK